MSLMSFTTTRTASARIRLPGSVRRKHNRRHLTAQERINLQVGYHPPAIITASLGGSTPQR